MQLYLCKPPVKVALLGSKLADIAIGRGKLSLSLSLSRPSVAVDPCITVAWGRLHELLHAASLALVALVLRRLTCNRLSDYETCFRCGSRLDVNCSYRAVRVVAATADSGICGGCVISCDGSTRPTRPASDHMSHSVWTLSRKASFRVLNNWKFFVAFLHHYLQVSLFWAVIRGVSE